MTIEQKPELNRFVDSSIPVTWAKRWRAFKLALPVWVFACVCMMEMGVLVTTKDGRSACESALTLAASSVLMFALFWGLFELQICFYARSKRILTIKDKRIVMNPVKQPSMPWKSIAHFQFEPIPENLSLTKLSVFVHHFKRIIKHFALVIENPAQVPAIIGELESKRHISATDFKIVVLEKPEPPPTAAMPSVLAMSLTVAGAYLLAHGLVLLSIALMPRPHMDNNFGFRPGVVTVFGQFLAEHFPSVEKLRHFYLGAGIILTLAGLALVFWRSRMSDGKAGA